MTAIEDKIAKLLAKAEGTNHPAEAETFMAKAEELMLKHGIERAMLESRSTKRQEIIVQKVKVKNGHGYAAAMVAIGHAVGPNFSVRTLQNILPDGSRMLWLIGYKSDVENAEILFTSLSAQSRAQALHWWKTEGRSLHPVASNNDAYLIRREFIYAFASGVHKRLEETRSRLEDEGEPGTALVLVERSVQVDTWIEKNMQVGKGRTSRRRSGGREARIAGERAGREAVTSKELR